MSQENELTKAIERLRTLYEACRDKDVLDEKEKSDLNKELISTKELLKIEKEQLKNEKESNSLADEALKSREKQVKELEEIIKLVEKENARLTIENKFWKALAKVGIVTTAVIMFFLGYTAGSK